MNGPAPDRVTADDLNVELCTVDGTEHDWRIHEYDTFPGGPVRRSFRCVWCHALACGDVGKDDPCMEPYHHPTDHVSKAGLRWPLGGDRP